MSAPDELFRRVEYDKTTKRARVMFCLKSKPEYEETAYVPRDLLTAMTAERDALKAELDAPNRHAYKVGIAVGRAGAREAALREAADMGHAHASGETRNAVRRAILSMIDKGATS